MALSVAFGVHTRSSRSITTQNTSRLALAKVARESQQIHDVLDIETERGKFTKLMNAFREALVHDLDADGFADMYRRRLRTTSLGAHRQPNVT